MSVSPLAPLSVVIPTRNRAEVLGETLRVCLRFAKGLDLEIVVIDDGSTDHSADVVRDLGCPRSLVRLETVPQGGPGAARNRGAEIARHDVLHFLGDDIRPRDAHFFRTHAAYHAAHPERRNAMLGIVEWPDRVDFPVNFVMDHVAGEGGEQFGYAHLRTGEMVDWRFFYTANVSIKKGAVDDWCRDGFDPRFSAAAWEDIELAYRLSQEREPLQIFYSRESVGTHYHHFSVQSFLDRQERAGAMAAVFVDLHPKAAKGVGVRDLNLRLRHRREGLDASLGDFLAVAEGLCAWARLLEARGQLGETAAHAALLRAVFRLRFLEGYLTAPTTRGNLGAGYQYLLEEVYASLRESVRDERFRDLTRVLGTIRGAHRWSWAFLSSSVKRAVTRMPGFLRLRARIARAFARMVRP